MDKNYDADQVAKFYRDFSFSLPLMNNSKFVNGTLKRDAKLQKYGFWETRYFVGHNILY